MINKDELNQLLAELANVRRIREHTQLFRHLNKKNYNKALRHACKHCHNNDANQLQVIAIILKYKKELNLNLNEIDKATQFSSLMYAGLNKNQRLYDLLVDHGANAHGKFDEKSPHSPQNIAQGLVREKINPSLNQGRFEQLMKTVSDSSKLPPRNNQFSDVENAKFDVARVSFIIAAIDYLINLETLRNNPEQRKDWCAAEIKEFSAASLEYCNTLLIKICETIFNLSYSFRERYSKSFGPASFTWVTFEQLGGSLQFGRQASKTIIPMGVNPDSFNLLARLKFSNEVIATADIVETALIDIIKSDLPTLAAFFKQTLSEIITPTNTAIPQIKLPIVKALTAYVRDRFTLVSLINLVNYTDNENTTFKDNSKNEKGTTIFSFFDNPCPQMHLRRFRLDTLMGRHAALRRLEELGEFVTGKNSSASDLDDTIDWQAFITIRDTITHQDEKDNQYKVNLLLDDIPRLTRIFTKEFVEIDNILNHLLLKRAEVIKHYDNDPVTHWGNILKASKDKYGAKPAAPVIVQYERRASIQDEAKFINNMQTNNSPLDLIKLVKDVFSGEAKLPPGKVSGQILSFITSNKVDRDLNKELKLIWTNALDHGSKNRDERMEKTQQDRAAKQNRELQRDDKFVALPEIRALARDFSAPENQEYKMHPLKRVSTAIVHLENIQLFLNQVGYFNDLNQQALVEGFNSHRQNELPTLCELLMSNHQLRDAIEYNLGQTLQQLDRICELNVGRDSQLLQRNLEKFRAFRNYLEHGNLLVDKFAYVDDRIPKYTRIEKYPAVIMQLLVEILPELYCIKDKLSLQSQFNIGKIAPTLNCRD